MPLDIGLGLLLGIWLHGLTTLNYGICLLIGASATLLPDLDFVWKAIKIRAVPHSDHRDGLHYPLLIVLPFTLLAYILSSPVLVVYAIGTFLHFIHDSIGLGWGIKWLYPFKKNSYLFLFQARVPTNKELPKKLFYSWSDSERKAAINKYADPQWVRHIYLQPHPFGLFEYAVLILGVVMAVINR